MLQPPAQVLHAIAADGEIDGRMLAKGGLPELLALRLRHGRDAARKPGAQPALCDGVAQEGDARAGSGGSRRLCNLLPVQGAPARLGASVWQVVSRDFDAVARCGWPAGPLVVQLVGQRLGARPRLAGRQRRARAAVRAQQVQRANRCDAGEQDEPGSASRWAESMPEVLEAERDELIKRAKGAKMGETVMTKFEEESKEYRDVRTSLFSRAERAQTEHTQFLNVSRPSLFAGTRQKARPAAQGAGEQNQPSDRLCA